MDNQKLPGFLKLCLILGYLFLYVPIISLIVYSFNDSKLVTVWGGFSVKWYGELLEDDELLSALWLSVKVALSSAFAAIILGTIAGFVMARFKRFRGSTLFAGMLTAPMVMPEVITGLSMLLLFISMQQVIGVRANAGCSPSGSAIPRCAWPMCRWWSVRGWSRWTAISRMPPWTSAPGR